MAQRRMLDKQLVMADEFLECTATARNLYFALNLMADDDGFVSNPRGLARMVGCDAADLQELIRRGYVLRFPSGTVVITHWLLHNSIRKDRYHPTICREEYAQLAVGENGQYILSDETHPALIEREKSAQTVEEPTEENSLVAAGEGRGVETSSDQSKGGDGEAAPPPEPPPPKRGLVVKGEYENVIFTPKEWRNLLAEFPSDYAARVERLSEYLKISGKTYHNHLAVIRKWAKEDIRTPSHKKASYDPSDLERLINL